MKQIYEVLMSRYVTKSDMTDIFEDMLCVLDDINDNGMKGLDFFEYRERRTLTIQ